MALIYANAVNKRMNNSGSKQRKKLHMSSCSILDDSPTVSARESRRGNGSSERTPSRKISCNVPLCMQTNQTNHSQSTKENNTSAPARHRPIHRSKTSCCELVTRDVDEEALRKTSHQPICHSASQTLNRKPTEENGPNTKDHLLQDFNLEHGYINHLRPDRRRSISLDADQWSSQITGSADKQKKNGAFQKMKRKFSKWKFPGRSE
ncbi:hypothetical protein V3C99_017471 [Haemonchus contortus]